MATYAIGDVQGCFEELQELLSFISFNPSHDILWFTGDLINRGPQSLATLRFIKGLGNSAHTVLGNHDLHFLAVAYEKKHPHPKDTLSDIYQAPDVHELCHWLQQQPLIHVDNTLGYSLVHAGLYPLWTLQEAIAHGKEAQAFLQSEKLSEFLSHMYGNEPSVWSEELEGFERLRFITNAFTRMRFCNREGKLDLLYKGNITHSPSGFEPWYRLYPQNRKGLKIIFGHWASLQDTLPTGYFCLDTGCVWGGELTALRLEDEKIFSVPSKQPRVY